MPKKRIAGLLVLFLLFLSILSSIYLILQQRIERSNGLGVDIDGFAAAKGPYIGVVEIFGPIYSPYEESSIVSRSILQESIETLKNFREDDKVKAVIIRINSPGGTIGAVQEITSEINRVRQSGKPVVASVSDIAASGGYYIASACDKIVANEGSIIGSIGVIMMSTDLSGLMKKIGVDVDVIKSGPYKDAGSFYRPMTSDERGFFQDMIDDAYEQFLEAVSKGRNLPVDKLRDIAKGQLFTGRKAARLKLIDELGDFFKAKEITQELAGIADAKILKRKPVGWKKIINLLNQKISLSSLLGQDRFSGLAYIHRQ